MRNQLFPLREIQAAYWAGRTSDLMLGNVAAYCYYEYEASALDVDRLEEALRRLIARHDTLRLVVRQDGLQQVLDETPQYRVIFHDFSAMPPEEAEQRLERVRLRLSHQILPLDRWPLFVAELTRLPQGQWRFHFGFDLMMCDAASFRILIDELARLYVDHDVALPPIDGKFRDYVLGEQELRRGEDYQRSRRYWTAGIDRLPPAPALPHRVDPDTITAPRFVRISQDVEPPRWSAVKAHAAHHRVTPTAVLLALYAETLARYCGERRLTLNVPIFNRLPIVPHVERMIGDFTSLIPLVFDGDAGTTFIGRAREVQKQLWQGLDRRIASDVVWRERARRGGGYRESVLPYVFTSVLGLDDPASNRPSGWPVAPLPVEMSSQTPQVIADFIVLESGGRLRWALHHLDELFHRETIDGIIDTLSLGLEALERGETWHAAALPTLAREAELMCSPAPRVLESDLRLEHLFLESVERNPDNAAVIMADQTLSYRELERRSASLARRIRNIVDATEGSLIAVVMPKGWEQVAAVLGILRSGAAYVPVDSQLPQARIITLLRESGATIVLTRSDVDPWLEWPPDVTRILVDKTPPAAGGETVAPPAASSDALAYVIYTSGSTGVPKGVMISHRGAVNTIREINRMGSVTPSDRILAVSALGFDLSVYDVFGMLAAGAAVVMPETGRELNPEHWRESIDSAGVTIWNSVPALLQVLLDGPDASSSVTRLRLAMVSGDWIPLTLPATLREAAPGAKFLAMGGATEASIWSNYKWVEQVEPNWSSIPYGRPLPNQSMYVLDRHLNPCPMWTPGELYIGGAGVALGYFNDAERTAASFIVHPQTGERLYRTGDFGRYLPDGEIEFLGRRDTQVKVHGHRIELGEIESVLMRHDSVRQCAVVATGEQRRLTSLVAFLVIGDSDVTRDEMRLHAAAHLPPHMVPREIIVLDELPLTTNGKIDRRRLVEQVSRERPKPPYVEPRNSVEETVATFWMEVLQLERVGIHDDFFELGGDSLAATRIITRVNTTFACSKSIQAVFDRPTVADLCSDIGVPAGT